MSARTDLILPITNEYMQQITSGNKNYDFRRVYIAFSVCRVWFYLTAPHSEIGYISEISPAGTRHHPGDQPLVEDGLGNRQFNQGGATRDGVNYAYRLRSVYKLKRSSRTWDLDLIDEFSIVTTASRHTTQCLPSTAFRCLSFRLSLHSTTPGVVPAHYKAFTCAKIAQKHLTSVTYIHTTMIDPVSGVIMTLVPLASPFVHTFAIGAMSLGTKHRLEEAQRNIDMTLPPGEALELHNICTR
jgi:hypothetical protein